MEEITELVDVSNVSEAMQLTDDKSADREEEPSGDVYLETRSSIANLRERFAAFLIDSTVLFYLYFIIGMISRRAFYGSWDGPIPSYGWQGLAFHGIFLFVSFMYYFILEGVFYTTLGKFLCWMYVRQKDGDLAAMSGIFARNVFRLIDYAVPLLPLVCMELTRKRQRFGDLVGGTTVIKKHSLHGYHYNVTASNVATASGRFLSAIVDFIIAGALIFGYILFLSPDYPSLSKWLFIFSPVVPALYFIITEPLTHTSPGKWALGYVISHEDGSSISFSGSVVRTFMRAFDSNPIGLIAMWLSPKRQRLGDLAADTIVTRQKRRWPGGVALASWVVISLVFLFAGLKNSSNIFKDGFRLNFLPTLEIMGDLAEDSSYKELTLAHLRLAQGDPNTIRTPAVFKQGETIFIMTDVYGYRKSGRMAWLQEDLEVRYPDASIGVHQENIVDYHQVVPSRGAVELTNSIQLPENAQAGTYTITIVVRDLFGHQHASIKQTFEIKEPAGTPSSPDAQSPAPASDGTVSAETPSELQALPGPSPQE